MKLKLIIIAIVVILLLLLLWWYFVQTEDLPSTEDLRSFGTESQGITKVHEEEVSTKSVRWDDCCEGEITVEFEFSWWFYFDDWHPEGDCCHNPVEWTVKDSKGREVFSVDLFCPYEVYPSIPTDHTKTITGGIWDCINPWTVTVENGCLYPINYRWEMTMYCLETTESPDTDGFDFWDWLIFWD